MGKLKLFEILVPTKFNSGRPVRTKHHKEWDKFVHKLAGGLTLLNQCMVSGLQMTAVVTKIGLFL